ncbi:WD domain [Leishmania braziliensis]|nr:WD domain [Leishmania braziliensis]
MCDEAFILQADGREHISDVRFVSSLPHDPSAVLTASRDNTAKLSTIPTSGDTVVGGLTFIGHTAFVNYVLFHPGMELLDHEACIVTGSNDKHVALWNAASSAVEAVLDGHNSGTCCGAIMYFTPGSVNTEVEDALAGDIISGDWSGTVLIFDHKSGRPKQLYNKHSTAIRGVAQLTNTSAVVTGSGDKMIHAWDALTGKTIQIFSGHQDVVQCICAVDSTRFASAGNDCTVRLWSIGTEGPLQVMHGHDSLIYSISWSPALSELYTASEDHTVRVWRSSGAASKLSTVQVIQHPCVVWSVAPTSDGRLLSGGSDHTVRVWTRNYEHMASIEKLEALETAVSSQTMDVKIAKSSCSAAASGGLDLESMPFTHEIVQRRGTLEGERLFARNEKGEVELYVWNVSRWEKIGVVVAGTDAQRYTGTSEQQREKHFYKGQSYDYLFDVNVEGRMLKLPYNIGDSVVETAKRFIQDHAGVVAQDSQEEIQNFLMAHVSPEDLLRIPGLESTRRASSSGTTATASLSPPASPAEAERLLPAWEAPQLFDTFNAAAAQTKVNALLPGHTQFHYTVEAVSPNPSDPSVTCSDLLSLYAALPAGSRFPATDALRYLLTVTVDRPDIVGETLAKLATIWGSQAQPPQLPTSAAEWMVALRLAASVFGRLCDARVQAPTMTGDAQEMLVWLAASLPSMTKLITSDTPASMRTNCRAATAALLRNVTVVLRSPGSSLATAGPVSLAERLAVAVVQQSAVLFVVERNDSPVVRDSLRSLRSLLLPTSPSPPAWRAAVVAQMLSSLTSSLKGIATGACVEGQPTAAWLLAQVGCPVV